MFRNSILNTIVESGCPVTTYPVLLDHTGVDTCRNVLPIEPSSLTWCILTLSAASPIQTCHIVCHKFADNVSGVPLISVSSMYSQAIQSFDIINITVFSILKLYTQLTDMGKHVSLCWIPSHFGIKGNEMADNAAKEGIRSVITQSKIPRERFFPHISKLCMEEW